MTQRPKNCRSCVWWRESASTRAEKTTALRDPDIGTCQARPPWVFIAPNGEAISLFPSTHADRFCRDWQTRNEVPL